ncbi:MAG TPA: molybdopterin-binding protein, partial [Roseimicrobium sp.]|nr:molybdopterin-binding protein [Roseimicrobium sp.]
MKIDIINTGSELMLGRVLNTHQQWLCRQLADIGYVVERQVAIADTATDIQSTIRESLGRADLIITTGGLGPTSDDLTRDLVAGLLERKLHVDEAALANIQSFFSRRKRPMPESTKVQAMVPDGAIVLQNAHGTAPGLAIQITSNPFRNDRCTTWLIMLPGPPRELHPMFKTQVVPLLLEKLPLDAAYVCRTLRTTGIGESWAEEKIAAPLKHLVESGLDLGYCARTGEVDIRLAASGCGAQEIVNEAETIVRKEIENHIFGEDDQSMESVIVQILASQR